MIVRLALLFVLALAAGCSSGSSSVAEIPASGRPNLPNPGGR